MTRRTLAGVAVTLFIIGASADERAVGRLVAMPAPTPPGAVPTFQVDATWPKIPNDWVLGNVSSVAVNRRDHVWILHRPNTVPADKRAHAAPPVLEFDANGKFVNAWGGAGQGYDWPDAEHGINVDYKDNVWITGSNPHPVVLTERSDDMLLKFTSKGKLLLQIGGRDSSGGNKDTKNVKESADVFVYPKTNEAFVADGYGNRRVVVFDADTGAFKRMWGAFGNVPEDAPPIPVRGAGGPGGGGGARGGGAAGGGRGAGAPTLDTEGPGSPQFGGPVHGVKVSNDELVYAANRPNRRVQVFTTNGKFIAQVFINRAGPNAQSAAGVAFSPDKDQQFMYVADYGNSHIVVLDRKKLEVLYQFGARSEKPGDFQGIHHLAADSKGNIYTAEVSPGNRAQRFVFMGLKERSAAASR